MKDNKDNNVPRSATRALDSSRIQELICPACPNSILCLADPPRTVWLVRRNRGEYKARRVSRRGLVQHCYGDNVLAPDLAAEILVFENDLSWTTGSIAQSWQVSTNRVWLPFPHPPGVREHE
jgi:hypothetical protein